VQKRPDGTIDPILERTFGWLRALRFSATPDRGMTVGATFESDAVLVRATYHWHDEYADVTVARRWEPEPAPYWAQVHLNELLEREGSKGRYNGQVRDERALEEVFARAAEVLREVATDQLAGRKLELLDDLIAKRPHRGVPGLDFPVAEPWAVSQEGTWFTTDFSRPIPIGDAISASMSQDASARVVAALRLLPGLAKRHVDQRRAYERLRELLADPDPDVKRAAASSLGQWGDVSAVKPILELLEGEHGDTASPFAAAATFLAIEHSRELRQDVRAALDRFATRGRAAEEQVAKLRWRLDDRPPHYPRVTQVFR
jgi:hypothetical protein